MRGRTYTVPFENVAVTATQDLFSISPATQKPCIIIGCTIDNVGGTADAGDAQEELLRLKIHRGFTTIGSAGSVVTPFPCGTNDTAAGFTAHANDTTIANTGTSVLGWPFGWNVRTPCREFLPEECWIYVPNGSIGAVTLLAAPADSLALSGALWVIELP